MHDLLAGEKTGFRKGPINISQRIEFCTAEKIRMATYTRMNAWNNGGTFANTDLLWYAKGVGAMQARAISDPASWWFFAAIHGQNLADPKVPIYLVNGWGAIP